ncbi:MAG: hypothetical protein IJX17_04870 [Clostridia bacterium]|nr:hypothetical protein [Clostridia bacterium]
MRSKKFTKKELINLLVKKASGFYYTEEQFEYEKKASNLKNISKTTNDKFNFENNSKNSVIVSGKINILDDTIELSNKQQSYHNTNEDLLLVKKKISTHYIPPDMIAIKILFENFEKKVDGNEIEKLNDEELLNLKNKLLEELKNENN